MGQSLPLPPSLSNEVEGEMGQSPPPSPPLSNEVEAAMVQSHRRFVRHTLDAASRGLDGVSRDEVSSLMRFPPFRF